MRYPRGDAAARPFFITPLHLHHGGQRGKYHGQGLFIMQGEMG